MVVRMAFMTAVILSVISGEIVIFFKHPSLVYVSQKQKSCGARFGDLGVRSQCARTLRSEHQLDLSFHAMQKWWCLSTRKQSLRFSFRALFCSLNPSAGSEAGISLSAKNEVSMVLVRDVIHEVNSRLIWFLFLADWSCYLPPKWHSSIYDKSVNLAIHGFMSCAFKKMLLLRVQLTVSGPYGFGTDTLQSPLGIFSTQKLYLFQ